MRLEAKLPTHIPGIPKARHVGTHGLKEALVHGEQYLEFTQAVRKRNSAWMDLAPARDVCTHKGMLLFYCPFNHRD